MRRLLCASMIVVSFCALTSAADPTPEDAVALLGKLKAKIQPGKFKDPSKIVAIDLARKKVTDNDLKVIGTLKSVRDLNLGGPILKNSGDKVIFQPKQIGDEGLKGLSGMTELIDLTLDGTHVTDAGLKHLSEMKKLKKLILSGTKVTDAGMEALTKLPKLETVYLYDTKVTDTGVGVLKRWKSEIVINR